ncbi:MAG: nucleotidyl transferase AbiEii/AbiGii toxin family protein [Butyrivibrio hungatei]|nr:nucleotidyl transferase AbiEii/AbiGii toxin family protein [Butyrivibrio hungatei]
MKTAEQLKGAIRNIAKDKNVRSQEVLQMFLFERILDRLAASSYKNNFILKGGLLISSMIGISERTTMDMDTTVRGIDMAEDKIERIVKEVLSIDAEDGIHFTYKRIEPIREDDDYNNFRVYMDAEYGKIKNPMKIDITTGDEITPAAVRYDYPLLFEERSIPVMAYTLETILAEKYETVIRRNIGTTRARDFYDLYALFHVRKEQIRVSILKDAVEHTARKRGSLELLFEWKEIIQDIREEKALQKLWTNYVEENFYASKLTFEEVVDVVSEIGKIINDEERES